MAASEWEVSVKGGHCIPKLECSHLKSKQNLWKTSLKMNFFILHFQSFCLGNGNIFVLFLSISIFIRSDVFIKTVDFWMCMRVCMCLYVCMRVCVCVRASAYVYVCINVTNQNLNFYNSKNYNCNMYNTISHIEKVSKVRKLKIYIACRLYMTQIFTFLKSCYITSYIKMLYTLRHS